MRMQLACVQAKVSWSPKFRPGSGHSAASRTTPLAAIQLMVMCSNWRPPPGRHVSLAKTAKLCEYLGSVGVCWDPKTAT